MKLAAIQFVVMVAMAFLMSSKIVTILFSVIAGLWLSTLVEALLNRIDSRSKRKGKNV